MNELSYRKAEIKEQKQLKCYLFILIYGLVKSCFFTGTMSKALGRLPAEVGDTLVNFLDSLTRWKLINLPNFG